MSEEMIASVLRKYAAAFYIDCGDGEAGALERAADKLAEYVAEALPNERLREALERAAEAMTCDKDDDTAHYCPNCDNSLYEAREAIRSAPGRGC